MWLTHDVVARMNAAVLRNSVVNGTWSWELTIEKCLALAPIVALCCRVGGVTRTPGYKNTETLLYKHIKVTLGPVPEATPDCPGLVPRPRFAARVDLHDCMGYKYAPPPPPPHPSSSCVPADPPVPTADATKK